MALLPFYWLLLTFVSLGSGALLYSFFFKDDDLNGGLSLPQLAVLGAALVSLECVLVSLAFPVGPWLIPVFGTQACAGFWFSHRTLAWPARLKLYRRRDMVAIGVVLLFALAMKAAAPVGSFDAGAYYRQTVLWLQQYGTVPGLGNLHGRLAFNSGWHVFAALFSFELGSQMVLEDVNEWLLFLFGMELAGRIVRGDKGPALPFLAVILAFVLPQFLTSFSADLPAVVLTIWLLMTSYRVLFQNQNSESNRVWIALMAGWLITIKLSMLPVALLLAGAWLTIEAPKLKWYGAAFILILMTAWAARFYMLTGYLAYPVPQAAALSLHPDWQVPIDCVKEESIDIEGFAKVPYGVIAHEKMPNRDRVAMALAKWVPLWAKGQNPFNLILIAVFLAATGFLGIRLARQPGNGWLRLGLGLFVPAGFALWFLKAPDPRFAYGLLVGAPFLALLILTQTRMDGQRFYLPALLALTAMCFDLRSLKTHYLLPGPYPEVAVKSVPIKGANVRVPVPAPGDAWEVRCWNQPVPCAPDNNPNLTRLELRGEGLGDGFRVR